MERIVLEIGLAVLLMAIAVAISHRLRVSAVPFLIIAGLVAGPHLPRLGIIDFRFENSAPYLKFLGQLGVLFLLFHLGLEFSISRLIKSGAPIIRGSVISITIHFIMGLLVGLISGFSLRDVLIIAGVMSNSSSAIVTKVIVDLKRTARPETGYIVGITMAEDLFDAAYLVLLSGVIFIGSAQRGGLAGSIGIMAAFLVGFLVIGRLLARFVAGKMRNLTSESFVLLAFTILFIAAGLSRVFGIAEALAALLTGLVLAESDVVRRLQQLIVPFRDLFGAFFFFTFGLSIDPGSLGSAAGLGIVAVILTILGACLCGFIIARLGRMSTLSAANIGLTLISRGEYSIIVASLAMQAGLLPELVPFTAVYLLILSIIGPFAARESDVVVSLLNKLASFSRQRGILKG